MPKSALSSWNRSSAASRKRTDGARAACRAASSRWWCRAFFGTGTRRWIRKRTQQICVCVIHSWNGEKKRMVHMHCHYCLCMVYDESTYWTQLNESAGPFFTRVNTWKLFDLVKREEADLAGLAKGADKLEYLLSTAFTSLNEADLLSRRNAWVWHCAAGCPLLSPTRWAFLGVSVAEHEFVVVWWGNLNWRAKRLRKSRFGTYSNTLVMCRRNLSAQKEYTSFVTQYIYRVPFIHPEVENWIDHAVGHGEPVETEVHMLCEWFVRNFWVVV